MTDTILTIDCGTQSLRALLFDASGKLLGKHKIEYDPYFQNEPGYAEQDPEVYWKALCDATKGLSNSYPAEFGAVKGIGVTTQRDSMICLDEKANPLRAAILWLDIRKANPPYKPRFPLKQILGAVGMGEAVLLTQEEGKCNWIMQNEVEIWSRTYKFVQVSGFLNARLCGRFADSTASQIGHMPFDYKKQKWSGAKDLNSKLFPIPKAKLPELVEPGVEIGKIHEKASRETGLPVGLPLIAAGSDKGCETIGMGVIDESMASLSFGTTATIQTTSKKYCEPLSFMPAYPAPIPNFYNPEVEIFRGYWMITWFKKQFAYEEVMEASKRGIVPEVMLNELLKKTPAGCNGLVMQPYWTPLLKMPAAKGSIIGFGDVHDRAYLYRSIIEGLAYGLKDGLESIQKASKKRIEKLVVSGGASQSDEICQISANVFNLPIVRGITYETSGLGAAMCVAAGLKMYTDVPAAVTGMTQYADVFYPEKENADLYHELFHRVYKKMYKALSPLYDEIRDITNYPEKLSH